MTTWRGRAVWCFLAGGLIGCTQTEGPSTAPREVTPLSAKALAVLADLTPPVARPARRPPSAPGEPRARRPFENASTLVDQGRNSAAVAELEKALGYAPGDLAVRRMLGLCYARLRAEAKAGPHLTAVADGAGDDVRVQLAMARIARLGGRREVMIVRYRLALLCSDADDDAPATNEALYNLGTLLQEDGYLTASLACYDRLAANIEKHGDRFARVPALQKLLDEPEWLLFFRGQLRMGLRRYDQAADTLDAAFRQNKEFVPASSMLIEALVAGRRFEKAEQVLLELLAGPAARRGTRDAIVAVYRAQDDPAGPARLLAAYKLRHTVPAAGVLLATAGAVHALGDADGAVAILVDHVGSMAADAKAMTQLAAWQFQQGRDAEALDHLATLAMQNPHAAEDIAETLAAAPGARFSAELARQHAAAARADTSSGRSARHYLAGLIARRAGLGMLSDEQLNAAIRADAEFVPAYEALAHNHIDRKEFDRALTVIERARTKADDPVAGQYLLGWIQLETGKIELAVEALSEVVIADKGNVRARVLLAQAYLRSGRFEDAERQLTDAVAIDSDGQAFELLVSTYLLRYEESRYLRGRTQADVWLRKAQTSVARLLATDSRNVAGLRLQVLIYSTAEQYLLARAAMARLFATAPDDVRTRLLRARLEARTGLVFQRLGRYRFQRIEADLTAALKADAGNAETLGLLGDAYVARQRYGDAAGAFAEARRRNTGDLDLAIRHATALAQAGHAGLAADLMVKALAESDEMILRLTYVTFMCRAGRAGQTIELLAGWAEAADEEVALAYELAAAYALTRAGQSQKVLPRLEKLLARAGQPHARHLIHAAELAAYGAAGKFDAMEAHAVKWQALATPQHWLARADSAIWLSDFMLEMACRLDTPEQRIRRAGLVQAVTPLELAVAWLCDAKQYDRAEAFALGQIAQFSGKGGKHAQLAATWRPALVRMLRVAGRAEQANRLFARFLLEDKDNATLLQLSQLLYTDDTPAKAAELLALLERAVKAAPADPVAANNLGYMLADRGVKLEQAERLIRTSLAAEALPNVQDSMGWVMYKKGRFGPALDYLLLAFNSDHGDNAVVYDHVGDCYWRLGRTAEAVAVWIEAADMAEVAVQREGDLVDADTRRVGRMAPKKIQAAKAGEPPPVAPLGEGVEAAPRRGR